MKNKYTFINNKKNIFNGSLVTIFILNILVINDASSAGLNHGFNELGETTVNIIGESGTSLIKTNWDGLAFNISKTNSSSQCNSGNQVFPQTTIDGYTGYEISPGVLFVIYSGTLSGYRGFSGSGVINYSYTFSASGILSPSTDTESPWCADPRRTNSLGYVDMAAPWGETTGSIRTGIYVSSSVNFNSSVSVPSFYVNRGRATNTAQPGPLVKGSGVTYTVAKPKLACTTSAPPTIDFGQVPAKGDGWVPLASKDSILQINCNGDSADAKATADISFTASPLFYGRSEVLEMMSLDRLTGIGLLNGRYGRGNQSNCSGENSDNADAIKFNGTISKTLDLNVGTNEIPITWTVCRRGDVQRFGSVSAQATANINWD